MQQLRPLVQVAGKLQSTHTCILEVVHFWKPIKSLQTAANNCKSYTWILKIRLRVFSPCTVHEEQYVFMIGFNKNNLDCTGSVQYISSSRQQQAYCVRVCACVFPLIYMCARSHVNSNPLVNQHKHNNLSTCFLSSKLQQCKTSD